MAPVRCRYRAISADNQRQAGWLREARRRLTRDWPYKSFGTAGFIAVFFVGYFWIADHPMFPIVKMPLTTLDRWAGFHPWTLALYATLWVYISLTSGLMGSKRELFSFAWGAAALSVAGMAVFFFWPTATPKADVNWALYPAFAFLETPSMARNACPSLHAAFAAFCVIWLDRLLRQMHAGVTARTLNLIWCAGILYSTLATRQHVAVDMYAGIVLGAAAGALNLYFVRHYKNP